MSMLFSGGLFNVIPDSGMFQNPVYQWWAGSYGGADGDSPADLPEVLAELSNAPAVGGPTYRADQAGFEAIEYDGTDDWHDASSTLDSQLPTGSESLSVAALVYINSTTDNNPILRYGADSNGQEIILNTDNVVTAGVSGSSYWIASGGSVTTGQWITVGFASDGAAGDVILNGSSVASDSGDPTNKQDGNFEIGASESSTLAAGSRINGFVAEVIVCAADESGQAFSDYHTDRLG